MVAARSSALRHPRTEIFRREIGAALVARALLVTLLGIVYLGLVVPIPHLHGAGKYPLCADVRDDFGVWHQWYVYWNVCSSQPGRGIIFMITMLLGARGTPDSGDAVGAPGRFVLPLSGRTVRIG